MGLSGLLPDYSGSNQVSDFKSKSGFPNRTHPKRAKLEGCFDARGTRANHDTGL